MRESMKRRSAVVIGMITLTLVAAACGSKAEGNSAQDDSPSTSGTAQSSGSMATSAAGHTTVNACMILDTGGVDDHGFNQFSWAGMVAAHQADPNIQVSYVPSNSSNDYTPNINADLSKHCNPIIGVGSLTANLKTAALANPKVSFTNVDNPSQATNFYGIQFNTGQDAFLGGYLAAGLTKTGKVATFGGAYEPPVALYMDGFWEGVQYYNKQHNVHVQVLGWNQGNQHGGTFVQSNNPWGDENAGEAITNTFLQQGADIVFPVAGGTSLGALAAAAASGGRMNVLWTDVDGCVAVPKDCQYIVGTVLKGLTRAVKTYLQQFAAGNTPTGSYIGTLSNGGVGLELGKDWSGRIPSSLKSELSKIKADIVSGKITITSKNQPKV